MKQENTVKEANIKNTLKNMHPDAIKIAKVSHITGGWEVLESDGFEETTTTYCLVGNRLELFATCVMEI